MKVYKMQCNQWSVGVGLRKSTIYDSSRWLLWVNHGYLTTSLSWGYNSKEETK
jgi:hypothetical protein